MTNLIYEATDIPDSDSPDIGPEYVCQECGTELQYSGRGRKPKLCTEKNGGNPSCPSYRQSGQRTTSGSGTGNSRKVDAALAVMEGMYDELAQILMFVSPRAVLTLEERIPKQQARNRAYFTASPKLCDRVCSWGGKGGTLAFLFSNLAMLAMVGRIAYADAAAMKTVISAMNNGTPTGEPDLSSLFAAFSQPGA